MIKITKLNKEQFNKIYDRNISVKEYDEIINLTNARVNYIVQSMLKSKNSRFWWGYDNLDYYAKGEASGGHFDPNKYKEYVGIGGECINFPEPYSDYSFPTRWLYEDFEEEFSKEVEKAKNELLLEKEKDKQKRLDRREYVKALIESAKSKLTIEEQKACRIYSKKRSQ